MIDCFVTSEFVLDLSKLSISYQEENPRFKDTFFTQFSLPFEFSLDADIRMQVGNYTGLNISNLQKKHTGIHLLDGKARKGVLEILSVEGNIVQAQIDSGFEELPNFDKKLCDLPLLKFSVPNIYDHANEIFRLKYPQVNYNFPRVAYTKKNNGKTDNHWEEFRGFLNYRDKNEFTNNNESAGINNLVNRNIIHPMPYLLYVLKTGFADAGLELAGDILTDEDFAQQVIYSGIDYFSSSGQEEKTLQAEGGDFQERAVERENKFGILTITETLSVPGTWRLVCDNLPIFPKGEKFILRIKLDSIVIREVQVTEDQTISFTQLINIEDSEAHKLQIESNGALQSPFKFQLNIVTEHDVNGNVIEKIFNLNEINLKKAVPDMTFGDLVKTIKNWKNYDMFIKDKYLYMNRIQIDERLEMKDFQPFAVEKPKKTFLDKRSYWISFPEMDDKKYNYPSIFIDENGVQLSQEAPKNSTQIQIKGYQLPLALFHGERVPYPRKNDSQTLGLIWYEGVINYDNFALEKKRLMPPFVSTFWKDWYKMRIASNEVSWSFITNKNQFRHFQIRDILYAYGQRFYIKSLVKNTLDNKNYQVEITAVNY